MLTPNDVRSKLKEIEKGRTGEFFIMDSLVSKKSLLCELYAEVLREISKGSIDPKSLALAALGIEV